MKNIRSLYPDIKLKSTRWGEKVHTKEFSIQPEKHNERKFTIPTRDFRKIIMDGLKSDSPDIIEHIVGKIAELYGLPKDLKRLEDLNSAMRKKEFHTRLSLK